MRFPSPFEGVFARIVLSAGFLVSIAAASARAQSWIGPSGTGDGGSWATSTNWNPATVPNAIGASVIFDSPPAARIITVDSGATGFTVGSLTFNDNSAGTTALNAGTTGSKLILDNGGSGVTITTNGAGIGNNTVAVPLVFNEMVTGIVNQTSSNSAAGSLNLTTAISGTGGFTKQGDGLATFGTGAKTYTGATILDGGRMRISVAAFPTATSSFTINAGSQLELITNGTITFSSNNASLNLNGVGATNPPFSAFPGAIRNTRAVQATITNPVVLQTDSLIHVQATAGTGANPALTNGFTALSGNISGPGRLTFTAPNSDIDQGFLILSGSNTYAGGTLVAGGILQVKGTNATLGTGNVTVDNATSPNSIARLQILAGVSNAIADSATLSLKGGGTAGVADQNFIFLDTGVNEVVAGLVLNGATQAFGTYGSSASSATFQNDEFFSGTGIITVAPVPEPAGILLVCGLAAGGAGWLRRRIGGQAV
jgi:autotransporter-associated beta strand protein